MHSESADEEYNLKLACEAKRFTTEGIRERGLNTESKACGYEGV